MPVISRNQPAYASSEVYPVANANDVDYARAWRSQGYPCWVAYDLSSVPVSQRGRVYSEWSNGATFNYDNAVFPDWTYNLPGDYVIEGSAAAGGGQAPSAGWVTLVRVTGNTYHSAAHIFDMTGYNWARIRATAGNPRNASQNTDCALKWDIHDASTGPNDSWIFYGDSITAGAMNTYPGHRNRNGDTVDTFAKLINSVRPSYFPAQQDAGIGGLTMAYAISNGLFIKWLAAYPGRYVGIALGANDANSDGFNADDYYNELVTVVTQVHNAGKVPVIPTLVASRTSNIQRNGPAANEKIRLLYVNHSEVIRGPDLWVLFTAHPEWISADNLHPTETGYGEIRQAWADSVLSSVYAAG